MVYLTRKEHFNAAHRLHNPNWSEEKNQAVFGKCANCNFHGHNFDLFVTVKGQPNPDTGFVMNAHELSTIIKQEICNKLDHKNLNLDVEWFKGKMPTCEIVVQEIWKRLEQKLPKGSLHGIKLQETPRIYVEYFGE